VKYRHGHRIGDGVDAVDAAKEQQMRFAAKVYLELNQLDDQLPAVLSVISLTNKPPQVEYYISNIDDWTN
jgi:Holliday junction resolvase-like predicted endonuclease